MIFNFHFQLVDINNYFGIKWNIEIVKMIINASETKSTFDNFDEFLETRKKNILFNDEDKQKEDIIENIMILLFLFKIFQSFYFILLVN
jgi:hypothetical protein